MLEYEFLDKILAKIAWQSTFHCYHDTVVSAGPQGSKLFLEKSWEMMLTPPPSSDMFPNKTFFWGGEGGSTPY